MGKFQDLTGMTFGRLTVIERAENKNGHIAWRCKCSCGNECIVFGVNLKNGNTQSCGCLMREKFTKHGMCHTLIYHIWSSMLDRCENPNSKQHDNYGGRGIKFCDRWHEFQNFYDDVSVLPHFGEKGYTLDRIENDKDYEPGNVRWADAETQNKNKRNNIMIEYEGVQMCLKDAAKKIGINYQTLLDRYKRGDRGERLFRPVKK